MNEYKINTLIKIYLRLLNRFKNVKKDIYDDFLKIGVHVLNLIAFIKFDELFFSLLMNLFVVNALFNQNNRIL
jgi:hypothetical protein